MEQNDGHNIGLFHKYKNQKKCVENEFWFLEWFLEKSLFADNQIVNKNRQKHDGF